MSQEGKPGEIGLGNSQEMWAGEREAAAGVRCSAGDEPTLRDWVWGNREGRVLPTGSVVRIFDVIFLKFILCLFIIHISRFVFSC